MNEEERIKALKKFEKPAFICQHLFDSGNVEIGFHTFSAHLDTGDLEAWCDLCEESFRVDDKDTFLDKTDFVLVYRLCFEKLRAAAIKYYEKMEEGFFSFHEDID